jgi:hypothetical protein
MSKDMIGVESFGPQIKRGPQVKRGPLMRRLLFWEAPPVTRFAVPTSGVSIGQNVPLNKTAASAYAQLISDQLVQVRAVKASVEQRALVVTTTSGTLVTLVFGFGQLSRAVKSVGTGSTLPITSYSLGTPAREFLTVSLALFGVAFVLALVTQIARSYPEISTEGFTQMLQDAWWTDKDSVLGAQRVAEAQATITLVSRNSTNLKALLLNAAVTVELAAVLCLVGTMMAILYQS